MVPSKFQFTNPVLTKMAFLVNEGFSPEENKDTQLPFETKFSVQRVDSCMAYVSLQADVAEESQKYPFCLSAVIGAHFRWDQETDSQIVEALLKNNAPALLLGYLRPYIAQITMAGPFQPVHIPFMNFMEDDKAGKP